MSQFITANVNFFKKLSANISWPNWTSPVFFGVFIWGAYSIYALVTPGFGRGFPQYAMSVGVCFVLDTVFFYLRTKQWRLTLGGLITGFAVFFLLDSAYLWIYFLTSALAMVTKHLLTYKNRHIFNPTNFALLIVCYAFQDICTFHAMRWGGQLLFSVIFILLGIGISVYAKRWIVSASFIGFFVLFAFVKSLLLPVSFMVMMLPLLGPGLQLYSFFMLTDPQTSPSTAKQQIIFSFSIALIDTILRYQQNRFAPLISLSFVCLAFAVVTYLKDQSELKHAVLA